MNQTGDEPAAQPDTPMSLVGLVQAELVEYTERREHLLAAIKGLAAGRRVEIYRRHLEGMTLKTTYNYHRVRTLRAEAAKIREELKPLIEQVLVKELALHFAEMELKAYEAAESDKHREREVKKATGLYADAADFIDKLYDEHEIGRDDLAGLTQEDVAEIAAVIGKRVEANVESGVYDQAIDYARSF
ncbi:hypothetical protein [Sphingomonas hankookensis]|uniref:hypothetical protein n=1 Tax=Sphingomonas hankookensis TaxID=563996 RepID=UPI00234E6500|nr:hypothetical protein [Sphingomonas hankookensis]WCP73505.1 hypothetical protein PPZ50_08185 [Sphingomonas hankookensis]